MAEEQRQDDNKKVIDEILEKHFDKVDIGRVAGTAATETVSAAVDDDKTTNIIDNENVIEPVDSCTSSGDEEEEGDDDKEEETALSEEELAQRKLLVGRLKDEGNASFKACDYEDAINKYKEALRECPKSLNTDRAILFSNRATAELKLNHVKPAIRCASKAIKCNPNFFKGYLRRAKAYELDNDLDKSLADYQKVVELEPTTAEAHQAIPDLKRRIDERNETMKTEVMAKLKDLGNLVLRPFGLSTNNFQMTQNSDTGGYSFNFKQ